MSSQNPWQDEYTPHAHSPAQHTPYTPPPQQAEHGIPNHNPYAAYTAPPGPPPTQQQQQHAGNPYGNEGWGDGSETAYSAPSNTSQWEQQHPDPWSTSSPSQQQQQHQRQEDRPALPPRRTGTDLALPQGQERTHQIEVMQSYEAAGKRDEDDANVEILAREFPGIDGSLIAAIYGDSKSLSATREMLGELEGR